MNVIVIGDLGKKLQNLPKEELGKLIQDMRDPASEDPHRTLVRHFAGDIAHDISTRLGEPIKRQLTIPDDFSSFTISLEYPESLAPKTREKDFQDFIYDRKRHWTKQYEDALCYRAKMNGAVTIEKALSVRP